MQRLPHRLYRAAEVRALDRLAADEAGLDATALMERAGQAAWTLLRRRWPEARRLHVFCGHGNNGGDGYVLARLARAEGWAATVFVPPEAPAPGGAAGQVAGMWREAGGKTRAGLPMDATRADVVVDALIGTGLDRAPAGGWKAAIEATGAAGRPVLALDVPSGLNADAGSAPGAAVRADATITFVGVKRGLVTGAGRDLTGELVFSDLGLPDDLLRREAPAARLLTARDLGTAAGLGRRSRGAHKGHFGHVLVIGGDEGMGGAVRLAAEAALRAGAGLVTVATRASHAALIAAARPELMARGVESGAALGPLLARVTVVAVGPGLGTDGWGRAMLARLGRASQPLVADADALDLLAHAPGSREDRILTPHPGEAARLLGASVDEIEQDRFAAASALRARYGGVVVLKGAGTIIDGPQGPPAVCGAGNPGMASGGMGDVLTGIIAGLLAQGLPLQQAAETGVLVHGAAGDRAARRGGGERGLIAGTLLASLPPILNPEGAQ